MVASTIGEASEAMTILLFCDMEGVAGIQCWEQTGGSSPLYEEGRRLYTQEVNAAVRGLRSGGATCIVAQDGHGGSYPNAKAFMNWIPDQLEAGAEYVRGYRWAAYVEPLRNGECSAVAFLGAHARAGNEFGVLCHTVSADGWHRVLVNGIEVGESEILTAIAGSFGVPAVCISGDDAACEELADRIGEGLVRVPVKWGLSRYAARSLAPVAARERIEAGFCAAVRDRERWPAPLRFQSPVTVTVEFASPDRMAAYLAYPGTRQLDSRTIAAEGGTFYDAWKCLWKAA